MKMNKKESLHILKSRRTGSFKPGGKMETRPVRKRNYNGR